jgi:tripartite ATP-independent transporter DctM subunit
MEGWMVPVVILGSFLVLLATGMPIAFALTGLSAILLWVFLGPTALFMVVASAFKQIGAEVFIAIPLFVVMAAVLQNSGIAESLYRTMHIWMGPLKGGLCIGTLWICALIDALSGIGATATTTMGVIAMPEMIKRGYDKRMVLGAITVGGALGPLIPPSVLMIIVGGYAQLSVGKLFIGGVLPGLLITACWAVYVAIRCALKPKLGPPMPKEERGTMREKIMGLRNVVLPLGLAFFIMAGIYTGIFTPTEAGGFGAMGALVISLIHRKFTWSGLMSSLQLGLRVTAMILWLVIGGGCFSTLVTVTGTGKLILNLLSGLALGPTGVVMVMLFIALILGCFIDPVAITMICVPIFIPVLNALGYDIFTFMMLFIMAVVIGYITPPFGLNLFYMKGVAPSGTSLLDIYMSATPYTIIMMGCLAICLWHTPIVTWLPSFMK